MYPTIILVLMMGFILLSNYLTLTTGEKHYKNSNCTIHDSLHNILPDLRAYHYSVDIIILTAVVSLYFLGTKDLIYELIGKFIIIMFIRAFTILTTILPKDEKCDTTLNISSFIFGGCFDKIFSGHTSAILLLTLLYNNFYINYKS